MATRLYGVATTAAPVSPGFDAGWQSTTGAVRRSLSTSKAAATETRSAVAITSGANNECLGFQLVSPPLNAGAIAGTVTIMTRGRELATTDNVDRRARCAYVVSRDGSTVRGTLLAQGFDTGATTELGTTLAGYRAANATALSSVTAQQGDRIVVELGYGMSGTGTTPQFDMVVGGNGTDHANADGDTTGAVPWVEFSQTLSFEVDTSPQRTGTVAMTGAGSAGTSAAFDITSLSVVAGDLLRVVLYKENTAAITPHSGYTQKSQVATTSNVHQLTTFWHRASGSESGTITFSWTGSVWRDGYVEKWTGAVPSGDPIADANTNLSNTSVSTAPAVSLTGLPAMSALAYSQGNFNGGVDFTPPNGYAETYDGDDLEGAWTTTPAGGSTGTVQGTANISSQMTAILEAIRSTASGQTVAVGQPSTTDTAQPVTRLKARAASQPSTTDTAQPAGRVKSKAVGQPNSTDSAQPVTRRKTRVLVIVSTTDVAQPVQVRPLKVPVGQPSTSDTAQPATRVKTRTVGQPATADTTFPVTRRKTKAVLLVSTTDTGQPVTRLKLKAAGQPFTTDTAQPVARRKLANVGQPFTTDTARAVSTGGAIKIAVGQPSTVDSALPVNRQKTRNVTQPASSDVAQPVTRRKVRVLAIVSSSDIAQPVARLKSRAVGQPSSVDTALPATHRRTRTVGQPSTVDIAQRVFHPIVVRVGQPLTVDEAIPIVLVNLVGVGELGGHLTDSRIGGQLLEGRYQGAVLGGRLLGHITTTRLEGGLD